MAYPPNIPASDLDNTTPMTDRHPDDHNEVYDALRDVVNELGSNPSGSAATVQARLDVMERTAAAFSIATTFSIPNAATTPIGWTVGLANVAWRQGDLSTIRVPVAGTYLVTVNVAMDSVPSGTRLVVSMRKNSSAFSIVEQTSGTNAQLSATGVANFAANDALDATIFHNSGSTRNANDRTNISVTRIA